MVTIVIQLTMVTDTTRICTVGARLMEVRVAVVVGVVVIRQADRQAMASATTMAVATTSSSRLKITTNRT